MCKLRDAIDAYKRSLCIYQNHSVCQRNSLKMVNAIKNLGSVYSQQGRHRKAIENFKRALNIEKIYGLNDIGMANTYNSLGVAYARLGVSARAMSYYRQAEAIVNGLCGYEWHADVADLFFNIGVTNSTLNRLRSAKYFLKRSLRIFCKCLGNMHPKTLRANEFLKSLTHRRVHNIRLNRAHCVSGRRF